MRTFIKIAVVVLMIAITVTLRPAPIDAKDSGSRSETLDFYLSTTYVEDTTINGQGGSSLRLNDDWSFSFGLGYNFNEHFQLNGLINFGSQSYDATVVLDDSTTRRYSSSIESSTLSLNGVYYFLSGNFTPFVSAGIGYTWVDTNIPTGPPQDVCWYDPLWGYICDEYVPTRTETDFSYKAGLGLRFDFNSQFGMQAGYFKQWIDIDKASGTPDFDTWKLDFIFRLK